MSKEPKIILWDIETTPLSAYTWTLWPKSLSHENIIEDWSIICGAWKELGKDKVHTVAIKKVGDDKAIVQKLRDALADADVIIHHNGDKFDIKKLNTRLIYHGLDPLPIRHTVDTLKEVKKVASFTSNRLDYIAKILVGQGKIHMEFGAWLKVMSGSKKAVKEMVAYNAEDVRVLERVYLWLRPYMKSHPHVGAIKGEDKSCSCPKCGTTNVKKNGTRYTRAGVKRQEFQCKSCYSYFQTTSKKTS
jgi:uncharacterized protein YprB with RNaseH-like and TPR domain